MPIKDDFKKHYIAVIGGSISGSEAANILAKNGFRVVVFDMNKLPYGKIEDGLPNWHVNLRNRQISEIDEKLNQTNILFVPKTKIGEDIEFLDLVTNWGFSAIILANGAWLDRLLPIPLTEKFIDKSIIYQNSFINWFNHKHEYNYMGKNYFIKNNVLVIGGGLASLDVVKCVMIELVKKQLFIKKGIDVDLFTFEKCGIATVLKDNNILFKDLKIKKVKLIYRRTAKDMPLKSQKDNLIESIEAAQIVSEKLLNKYKDAYLFDFIPLSIPISIVERKDKLSGLILQKVAIKNGVVVPIKDNFKEIKADMIISSIGSIPEKIHGLNYDKSSLKILNGSDCQVFGFENVFAIGNAVTGRGNIQESKKHGSQMTELIMDKHLTEDAFEKWLNQHNNEIKSKVTKQVNQIIKQVSSCDIQEKSIIQSIFDRTSAIHKDIGYSDYHSWIKQNTPNRLEDMSKNNVDCKCS